jgi:hypothetical protein
VTAERELVELRLEVAALRRLVPSPALRRHDESRRVAHILDSMRGRPRAELAAALMERLPCCRSRAYKLVATVRVTGVSVDSRRVRSRP